MVIDNGNHLLLSANRAALAYLETIGSRGGLVGPTAAEFAFVDLAGGERWTLRIGSGRVPWWIFDRRRRAPGTTAGDYLGFVPVLFARDPKTVCEVTKCSGVLYQRLARPLWVAALNTDPKEASATLAAAILRETLAAGGKACRPLIARDGLGPVFIEPALRFLAARDAEVGFGHRLRAIEFEGGKVTRLDFGEDATLIGPDDAVILAVPPVVATDLLPGLRAPCEFRAIVNAHFRIAPPAALAPITGFINATSEWLFTFPGRLSVTISAADRLLDVPRETLAATIWREVAGVAGLPSAPLPPWQIVRERRATFAATPQQNARRPGAATTGLNLALAGDWTDTGLPATIEGAIRSGNRAADLVAY
jgi:squalene-associated FAD-dependent desaturase